MRMRTEDDTAQEAPHKRPGLPSTMVEKKMMEDGR
jgi:hypothetical protein